MNFLAGIDIGSTTLKAVLYDDFGDLVASGTRPTERFTPYPDHPEWTVWQPEQIWGGCAAAMRCCCAGGRPSQYQSSGCDWHGDGWGPNRRER